MAFELQVAIRRNPQTFTYEAYSPQFPPDQYPDFMGSGFLPEDAVRNLLYRINHGIGMDSIEALGRYFHQHSHL